MSRANDQGGGDPAAVAYDAHDPVPVRVRALLKQVEMLTDPEVRALRRALGFAIEAGPDGGPAPHAADAHTNQDGR